MWHRGRIRRKCGVCCRDERCRECGTCREDGICCKGAIRKLMLQSQTLLRRRDRLRTQGLLRRHGEAVADRRVTEVDRSHWKTTVPGC
jgi:hypothetical protein